jgi:hypothetical protein
MTPLLLVAARTPTGPLPEFSWHDKPGLYVYIVAMVLIVVGLIVSFKGNLYVGVLIMMIGLGGLVFCPQGRYIIYHAFGLNLEVYFTSIHPPGRL